jgi:hypothetical protein
MKATNAQRLGTAEKSIIVLLKQLEKRTLSNKELLDMVALVSTEIEEAGGSGTLPENVQKTWADCLEKAINLQNRPPVVDQNGKSWFQGPDGSYTPIYKNFRTETDKKPQG